MLTPELSPSQRRWVMGAVLLGWMGAGIEMSLMIPTARPAIQDFVGTNAAGIEVTADQWLSWFVAAFLLGAAAGGLLFGWLADRAGRVRAMGASILCYSLITGLGYFARTPEQLLVLRFLACLGIGGMWPTGVALVSEALPGLSRPMAAGLVGTSANVGFLILGIVMINNPIARDSWRWVMLLGATPALFGLAVWFALPESPAWLAQRKRAAADGAGPEPVRSAGLRSGADRELPHRAGSESGAPVCEPSDRRLATTSPVATVFRPPLLRLTLLGILLGTIPLLGGWASVQRLVPWAGQVSERTGLPDLQATTQIVLACGAVLGSLLGGWAASGMGRRVSYFLMSGASLGVSACIFLILHPADCVFPWAVFALGLVSTMFYGWLPYFLPELFPTPVRATGIGVSYNFGRILSAAVLLSSTALSSWFGGDIAKMGAVTCLVYAGGLVMALVIPGQSGSSPELVADNLPTSASQPRINHQKLK
jgi:MFS family permease